jgi:uncharacterized membrane protein
VEIALRAISPGINDPNTAVTCVNWLTDGLRDLEQYAPKSAVHVNSGGNARVIGHLNEFQHVVAAAYGLIRQVAWNSQMLTIGVLNSISLIAPFVEGAARKEALKYTGAIGVGRLFSDAASRDCDVTAAYRLAVEPLHSPDRARGGQ